MLKALLISFLVLIAAAIGGGVYLAKSGKLEELRKQYDPSMQATKVRFSESVKGELVRTISAPGQVEPKKKVEISAQVSARIIALPFREGQAIKEGEPIVKLDGRDLAALLRSATAQLDSEKSRRDGAKVTLDNLRLEFNRRKELYSSKDISQTDYEQAEAEYNRAVSNFEIAQKGIEIAEANIERAEKDLENAIIAAPLDGVVTKLNAEVGELVVIGTLNNAGSVIMEVADLGVMLLKARIDEANIAPVEIGQRARVFINAYPDLPLTGVVEHIGLKREADTDGTAYFETDILIDKPKDLVLRSGLTANAEIQVEVFRDIVKVPSQSILDRPVEDLPDSVMLDNPLADRTKKFARVVFIMEDGKARPRIVKTGPSDLTHTIVTAGLEPGVRVISGPFKALETLKADARIEEDGVIDASKATVTAADAKSSTQPQAGETKQPESKPQ